MSQRCQNLKKMAKDTYSLEQFEPVELIIKKNKEKKEKMERKIREYEINIHSLKSGLNKLKIKYEQNKNQIESLEKETNNNNEYLGDYTYSRHYPLVHHCWISNLCRFLRYDLSLL